MPSTPSPPPPFDGAADRDRTVSRILARMSDGDRDAAGELLPRVYDELHRLASGFFRDQRPGHTLQPTALVHEAFLRLARTDGIAAEGRGHFFALAATVMRHVLVDLARRRATARRGGGVGRERVTLSALASDGGADPIASRIDVLALEDALERLAELRPEDARLVELRFHAGLTAEESAEALGISRASVARRWRRVRAWLAVELDGDGDEPREPVRDGVVS